MEVTFPLVGPHSIHQLTQSIYSLLKTCILFPPTFRPFQCHGGRFPLPPTFFHRGGMWGNCNLWFFRLFLDSAASLDFLFGGGFSPTTTSRGLCFDTLAFALAFAFAITLAFALALASALVFFFHLISRFFFFGLRLWGINCLNKPMGDHDS